MISTLPTDSLTLFRIRPGLRLWGKEKPVIFPKEKIPGKNPPRNSRCPGFFFRWRKTDKKIRVTSPGIEPHMNSTPRAAEFPLIKAWRLNQLSHGPLLYVYLYLDII